MARIFISYRRSDSAYAAATLNDKLQQHFGRDSVFFDVDNIPLGVDFREYIGNAVGLCDVLLVLMGDQWVHSTDDQGNRRIDNPSDFVRIEIESALKRNIPIVPVLVGEAEMPSASELPPSIQSIVFRNAAEMRAGRDLRQHLELLIKGLEIICRPTPPPEAKAISAKESKPAKEPKPAKESKPAEEPEAAEPAPAAESQAIAVQDSVDETEKPVRAKQVKDSSELLAEIQKILDGFTDNNLFVGVAIPPVKLNNAISAYAQQVSPEDVLLLYDNTFFGGAKNGLLLTADAVCWRSFMGSEIGQTRYAEIQQLDFRKNDPSKWTITTAILVNEKEIAITYGVSDKVAEAITNVIRHLKDR